MSPPFGPCRPDRTDGARRGRRRGARRRDRRRRRHRVRPPRRGTGAGRAAGDQYDCDSVRQSPRRPTSPMRRHGAVWTRGFPDNARILDEPAARLSIRDAGSLKDRAGKANKDTNTLVSAARRALAIKQGGRRANRSRRRSAGHQAPGRREARRQHRHGHRRSDDDPRTGRQPGKDVTVKELEDLGLPGRAGEKTLEQAIATQAEHAKAKRGRGESGTGTPGEGTAVRTADRPRLDAATAATAMDTPIPVGTVGTVGAIGRNRLPARQRLERAGPSDGNGLPGNDPGL